MTQPTNQQVLAVCGCFAFAGGVIDVKVCGNGHINSTYIITVDSGKRYVLQILNTAIFKDPTGVMNNIVAVTDHIRKGLAAHGEDTERGTMRVVPTKDGQNGCTDPEGRFWRAYDFVEHTVCRLTVDSPETFARVGEAFGDFQRRLADFDASRLYESIPDFHNTKKRYADFLAAVEKNAAGRVDSVKDEIKFITDHAEKCSLIVDALESGDLPLRVTHNDTKLSNILLDEVTDEAVCIIDLDTVMPGSSLYDFGDSIRTGAASAAEDEPNLDKVHFLPEMFKAYTKGFIKGTGGALTEREVQMLPDGGYIITLEQAIRFLGDYLDGDTYYHIDYPDHNLVRARTQLKLVAEMEAYMSELREFVKALR
ncbi:MAG: aminoglycoside phosphotransferase family protein [Ruminococcaceae bacterium]|nr:aminoglycoside phosphotransferase family protein [Oscillospiraceae bacterium]